MNHSAELLTSIRVAVTCFIEAVEQMKVLAASLGITDTVHMADVQTLSLVSAEGAVDNVFFTALDDLGDEAGTPVRIVGCISNTQLLPRPDDTDARKEIIQPCVQ